MSFRSTLGLPERILNAGGFGSGKTQGFLTIAEMARKTKSDARFFVLDTDLAMRRMLADPAFVALREAGTVQTWDVSGWEELEQGLAEVVAMATENDWLSIDLLTPTWDWVQEYFVDRIFHADVNEFFLQAREAVVAAGKKGGNPLDGFKDWTIINGMYRSFQNKLMRLKCNLYATAAITGISEQADQATKAMFGPFGVMPKGQKHTPHLFHTVLLSRNWGNGEWTLTTVKDRGRRLLEGQTVKNFALDYLKGVAGWSLA